MTHFQCYQWGLLSLFKPSQSFEKFTHVSATTCHKIIFLSTWMGFFCLYEGLKWIKPMLPATLLEQSQLLNLILHRSSSTALFAALGFALMTLLFTAVIMPYAYQKMKLSQRKHAALRQMALSSMAMLVVLLICGLGLFWLFTHAHWRHEAGLLEALWRFCALSLLLFILYCTLVYPLLMMSAATGKTKLKLIAPLLLLTFGFLVLEDFTNQGLYLSLSWLLNHLP